MDERANGRLSARKPRKRREQGPRLLGGGRRQREREQIRHLLLGHPVDQSLGHQGRRRRSPILDLPFRHRHRFVRVLRRADLTAAAVSRTITPVTILPSFNSNISAWYWSEITLEGHRIESSTSAFLNRLAIVVRSGPRPCRWRRSGGRWHTVFVERPPGLGVSAFLILGVIVADLLRRHLRRRRLGMCHHACETGHAKAGECQCSAGSNHVGPHYVRPNAAGPSDDTPSVVIQCGEVCG